jgi:2-methylcitrate dehydratase PrpD
MTSTHPSADLARFAASLQHADIPAPVLRRTEDLFLDWMASALAGKDARPVEALTQFWLSQGPAEGPCEVLHRRRGSSPMVAAAANAAASHFVEQDDVHNASVFHPAAVVFPVALAMAQQLGRSGRELLVAAPRMQVAPRAAARACAPQPRDPRRACAQSPHAQAW